MKEWENMDLQNQRKKFGVIASSAYLVTEYTMTKKITYTDGTLVVFLQGTLRYFNNHSKHRKASVISFPQGQLSQPFGKITHIFSIIDLNNMEAKKHLSTRISYLESFLSS